MSKCKVIAIANQKGGVGKSTTVFNLGAAPFAALGFVTYNGMTAEKFIWAWLKSEVIEPKKVVFRSEPTYYKALKENIEKNEKEEFNRYD